MATMREMALNYADTVISPRLSATWFPLEDALAELGEFESERTAEVAVELIRNTVDWALGRRSNIPLDAATRELTLDEINRAMQFAEFLNANA